jgi:signal transduction histidine kinase
MTSMADMASRGATGGRLPWEDARSFVAWWYRPLGEPGPWLAVAYLLVTVLGSVLWFSLVLAVLAVSFTLVLVGIGIPLTIAAFAFIGLLSRLARAHAQWVGVHIEGRPLRRTSGLLLGRFRAQIGDPARWRQVAYFLAAPFVASVLLTAAVGAWSLAVAPMIWLIDAAFSRSLPAMATAGVATAVVLGVAPRACLLLGRAEAIWTSWLLGPDRLAAMQVQVDSLAQQRAEILDAVASERHRIERNLHDGAQQRLVALGIDLGLARSKMADDPAGAAALLDEATDKTRATIGELRVIGRGLHPAILADRGLDAALSAVVGQSSVPIELHVQPGLQVPLDTEETAYYVISEALSNVMKHAGARVASVQVVDDGSALYVTVHDDGRGGANVSRGSGLAGIAARVRGADGTFKLDSPPGGPTVLTVELPHG